MKSCKGVERDGPKILFAQQVEKGCERPRRDDQVFAARESGRRKGSGGEGRRGEEEVCVKA